jgi:hypothetical protein
MPASHPHNADSESLQTDVMRFMAIIAFCLIAILALVRNGEPIPHEQAPRAPAPPERAQTPGSPAGFPAAASQPAGQAAADADPQPMKALEPLPRLPDDEHPDRSPRDETMGAAAPDQAPEEAPAQTDSNTPEAIGLSLRFASDRDFMRLVARGDIEVYAFRERDVLSLDPSFRLLESPAPARVYPLEPATLPALVTGALNARRADADRFEWGIRMPQRLEARIRALVDHGATGQLIIDRYGKVRHVAGG